MTQGSRNAAQDAGTASPRPLVVRQESGLLAFLFSAHPDTKKTKVRQWLKFGRVLVNGRPMRQFDHALHDGDEVVISSAAAAMQPALPAGMSIVFMDDDVIVIEKPAGLLSMATDTERQTTAYAVLTRHVRAGNPRSRERVWIVHRLDRETSGLMVFARTEAAKQTLQGGWQAAEKQYLAVVERVPASNAGTMTSHLDESNPARVFSAPPSSRTREAVTHYEVLKHSAGRALVRLTLETGRRHQIRVQLADLGCPIIGDTKYGARVNPAKRVALHACSLAFPHPTTGKSLRFESPLPATLAKLV